MRLTFLGAAGCVTGSRTLVEGTGTAMLVDCGLFQGYKELRLLNWKRFPARPSRIQAVALTHAHLDHLGWLPRLMREGFDGPVYCSPATKDLAKILLEDAARIQESDARQANSGRYSKHHPAKPLYTLAEAKGILRRFKAVVPGTWCPVGTLRIRFTPNGHILGSCMVEVQGDERVLFSGDLGRPRDSIMPAPQEPRPCDKLVIESTYGDRFHPKENPVDVLRGLLATARRKRGVLVIPSFAVGRSQALLIYLDEAMRSGKDAMPVYLDSPMSAQAVATMSKHIALTRIDPSHWKEVVRGVRFVQDADESASLHGRPAPFVLISSSGMATGGRVLSHLAAFGPSPKNTILLAGYQAGGTRGAALLQGAKESRINGRTVPIRATVRRLENVSAHADQSELLEWAARLAVAPKALFLNHGDPAASNTLREAFKLRLGWEATIPRMGDSYGA